MNEHFELTKHTLELNGPKGMRSSQVADMMRADSVIHCESKLITFEGAARKEYLLVDPGHILRTSTLRVDGARAFKIPIGSYLITIFASEPIYSPRKEFAIFKTFNVHEVEKVQLPESIDEKLRAAAIKPTPRYFNEHFKDKIPLLTGTEVDCRTLYSALMDCSAILGLERSLRFLRTDIAGEQASLLVVEKDSVVHDNCQLADEFVILIGDYVLTVISEGYVSAVNADNWFGFIGVVVRRFEKAPQCIGIGNLAPQPDTKLAEQQVTDKLSNAFKAFIFDNRADIRAYLDSLDS